MTRILESAVSMIVPQAWQATTDALPRLLTVIDMSHAGQLKVLVGGALPAMDLS